jgi:hypothetical protein
LDISSQITEDVLYEITWSAFYFAADTLLDMLLYIKQTKKEQTLKAKSKVTCQFKHMPHGEFVGANRKKQLDWLMINTDVITTQSHSLFACPREKNLQVENGLRSQSILFIYVGFQRQ